MSAETLPGLLVEQARGRPNACALRQKRLGIWNELTWADYAEAVREVALGLEALGVGAGDRVAVLAENDRRWLYADLGIQALGAQTVGVYPGLDAEDVAASFAAEPRVAFCGDQEHVDALLAVWDELGGVEHVIVFDTKGLHTPEYEHLPLETLAGLRERGRARDGAAARFDELVAARAPDDVATVAFTPGTTGPPRGVLHTHRGLVAAARAAAAQVGLRPRDRAFALLPLAHVTARVHDAYASLVAGSSVSFAETPDTTGADLVEISPSVLLATPRLLEHVKAETELRVQRAGAIKRVAYRLAVRGMAAGGVGRTLGRAFVGRFVVAKAGLGSVRYAGITGSAAAPDLMRWFWALGVPVRAVYGQVEAGGAVAAQRGSIDAGTVGPPVEGVELRVDDSGELLVRGPGLLAGVVEGEAAPLEDGWFRTGDLARLDEQGRLVPLGRRAHVATTAAGDEISPEEVESRLKVSPYVASAVVLASDRPFVAALVELAPDAVADWARRKGLAVTTYASLIAAPEVVELIDGEIRAANETLPPGRRVQEFRILPRRLLRELTPTGQVRRAVVEDEFGETIDDLYGRRTATATADSDS